MNIPVSFARSQGQSQRRFGARRFLGDASTEPRAMFGARIAQTIALIALAEEWRELFAPGAERGAA